MVVHRQEQYAQQRGGLNGEFFEGGMNLTVAGFGGKCFGTFPRETRASTSTDATLRTSPGRVRSMRGSADDPGVRRLRLPGRARPRHGDRGRQQPGAHPDRNRDVLMCTFAAGTSDLCDASDASHQGVSIGTGTLTGIGDTATADSPDMNAAASPLTPGRYCFRAGGRETRTTGELVEFEGPECFTVAKIASNTVTTPLTGAGHRRPRSRWAARSPTGRS